MRGTALPLALALLVGCGSEQGPRTASPPRLGGATFRVDDVTQRGPYLDAVLQSNGRKTRFFFSDDENCRRVIATENQVQWQATGPIGRVRLGDVSCDPIGIGSLREWRDRRPRSGAGPLPRAQATYRKVFEDGDVIMLRGRFPLASQVGWAGGQDTIAVLPRSPECVTVSGRETASIEFRTSGPQPLTMLSGRGRCVVQGFVMPLPGGF